MKTNNKIIKESSIDTKLLYQRLAKMEIGDFVSYEELNLIIGRNVQKEGRNYLNTARRIVERNDQKVFGVIISEGLKCLNTPEIINTAASSIDRIRHASRRSIKKFECISDLESLPNDEKIRLNTYASTLGAINQFSTAKSVKKIQNIVKEVQEQIPFMKMLDIFK